MSTKSGQANLGNQGDAAVAITLDRMKARGCKALALSEAGDRRHVVDKWCKINGWEAYWGDGSPGASSTPLLWDLRLTSSFEGTRPATDATYTGKLGAGPNVVKAKVLNHVRLHEEGEEPFVLISVHMPASLYLWRRRRLAKKIVRELVTMAQHRQGHVEVRIQGDFNGRGTAWVFRPLRKIGLRQHTHAPTFGPRCIDLAWTFGPASAVVVLIKSDHKGVVLDPGVRL